MSTFIRESDLVLPIPDRATDINIECFRHRRSQLRIVFAQVPGPICSAHIVVPTLPPDNKGLPHTLEHLVFCGSQRFPQRGYLDALANRCLADGTNAFTEYDHTAYTVHTAGSQGLVNLLPVFLDHVLNPLLRDDQFITEVYHVDGKGSEKGVVYSEMAAREMGEEDLIARTLRRLVYGAACPYANECGGLTPDIATLNNDQIKVYHQQYYNVNNLTITLFGDSIDQIKVFQALESLSGLLDPPSVSLPSTPPPLVIPDVSTLVPPATLSTTSSPCVISEQVKFPSVDEATGSYTYAWRGPPIEDVRTSLAVTILFRYLQENSASPFYQALVETDDPWATHVDFSIHEYVETCLELNFYGVPYKLTDDDDSDDEVEKDLSDNDVADSEPIHACNGPQEFQKAVRQVLEVFVQKGFPQNSTIGDIIDSYRLQVCKDIEDDPHEYLFESLVTDIVAHQFSPRSTDRPCLKLGSRLEVFKWLNELADEPLNFWYELAQKWLLDAPMFEIILTPDAAYAEALEQEQTHAVEERVRSLGPDGLAELQLVLDRAIEANKLDLPQALLDTMPPVPSLAQVPATPCVTFLQSLNQRGDQVVQTSTSTEPSEHITRFNTAQVVATNTLFRYAVFYLPLHSVPEPLTPYIPLFCELLFRCPLTIPANLAQAYGQKVKPGQTTVVLDYRDLVTELDNSLVGYWCRPGLGGSTQSTCWLSDTLMVGGKATPARYPDLCRWLSGVLFFSTFTKERILNSAQGLLREIPEIIRDDGTLIQAVAYRLTASQHRSEVVQGPGDDCSIDLDGENHSRFDPWNNSIALSIFRQKQFLQNVVDALNHSDSTRGDAVVAELNALRQHITGQLQEALCRELPEGRSLASLSWFLVATSLDATKTLDESVSGAGSPTLDNLLLSPKESTHPLVKQLLTIWGQHRQASVALSSCDPSAGKNNALLPTSSPFPYPRYPYVPFYNQPMAFHVAHPSAQSSHVVCIIPCDILRFAQPDVTSTTVNVSHPNQLTVREALVVEYLAVQLLCDLLGRTEGPLYTQIRGNGYAYGCSLFSKDWVGQLQFTVYDAVAPFKALRLFWQIVQDLETQWDTYINPFEFQTAKSTWSYHWASSRSTPPDLVHFCSLSTLRGFETPGDYERLVSSCLDRVTVDHLREAYNKHLKRFIDRSTCLTIALTPPSLSGEADQIYQDDPNQAPFRPLNLLSLELPKKDS
ncbi:hypothetical protein IWQ62_000684 [Dispira parvispora]|uniref:Uncharacterized protein n=1 Tax=Dispira parvispora TaxID=1520584 RepID=A0A9W8ATY5_9FUNG|nr:hypothetical protein IWQ62_000684 [Dispira parvispora]